MTTFSRPLYALLLLLLIGFASQASAQSNSGYIVELVIFSNPSAQLGAAEVPSIDWADSATQLSTTARGDVQRIDSSRYRLTGDVSKLQAQNYQVLLHQAWVQPDDPDMTIAVNDGALMGEVYPAQALIRLGRERLLEAHVTAWVTRQIGDAGQLVSDRLHQIRRLRLNETHYLDHQNMGVLITISRN